MSLVKMLENLKKAGITLAPEIAIADIEEEFDPADGYASLLTTLGELTEDERDIPISNNIWHFDTECIYGDGDYVAIVRRLQLLAGKVLPIEEISDHVDEARAWIKFTLNGEKYHWDLEVNRDWVNTKIFNYFANLLTRHRQDVQLICHGFTDCQDCLIGCVTPAQFKYLNSLPGLHFQWESYIIQTY